MSPTADPRNLFGSDDQQDTEENGNDSEDKDIKDEDYGREDGEDEKEPREVGKIKLNG